MTTQITGDGVDKVQDEAIQFADLSAGCVAGIIESGSNANGRWTKFADGTMICTSEYVGSISVSAYITGLYSGGFPWTFPVTFVGNVSVSGIGVDQSSVGWISASSAAGANASLVYFTKSSSVTSSSIRLTAIGRWK